MSDIHKDNHKPLKDPHPHPMPHLPPRPEPHGRGSGSSSTHEPPHRGPPHHPPQRDPHHTDPHGPHPRGPKQSLFGNHRESPDPHHGPRPPMFGNHRAPPVKDPNDHEPQHPPQHPPTRWRQPVMRKPPMRGRGREGGGGFGNVQLPHRDDHHKEPPHTGPHNVLEHEHEHEPPHGPQRGNNHAPPKKRGGLLGKLGRKEKPHNEHLNQEDMQRRKAVQSKLANMGDYRLPKTFPMHLEGCVNMGYGAFRAWMRKNRDQWEHLWPELLRHVGRTSHDGAKMVEFVNAIRFPPDQVSLTDLYARFVNPGKGRGNKKAPRFLKCISRTAVDAWEQEIMLIDPNNTALVAGLIWLAGHDVCLALLNGTCRKFVKTREFKHYGFLLFPDTGGWHDTGSHGNDNHNNSSSSSSSSTPPKQHHHVGHEHVNVLKQCHNYADFRGWMHTYGNQWVAIGKVFLSRHGNVLSRHPFVNMHAFILRAGNPNRPIETEQDMIDVYNRFITGKVKNRRFQLYNKVNSRLMQQAWLAKLVDHHFEQSDFEALLWRTLQSVLGAIIFNPQVDPNLYNDFHTLFTESRRFRALGQLLYGYVVQEQPKQEHGHQEHGHQEHGHQEHDNYDNNDYDNDYDNNYYDD